MSAVFELLLGALISIGAPLTIQWLDKRRMPARMRARTWNTPSWACALWAVGPLSLIPWFWTTRKGIKRGLGVLWLVALLAAIEALSRL